MTCGPPPAGANTMPELPTFTAAFGTDYTYKCRSGYQSSKTACLESICLADGSWSAHAPSCEGMTLQTVSGHTIHTESVFITNCTLNCFSTKKVADVVIILWFGKTF